MSPPRKKDRPPSHTYQPRPFRIDIQRDGDEDAGCEGVDCGRDDERRMASARPANATPMPRMQRKDRSLVVAFTAAAIVAICFVFIAEIVADQHTQNFDESVLRSFRRADNPAAPIGPAWAAKAARDISALGSLSVLMLVTAGVAGLLAIAKRHRTMWFLIAAVATGMLLILILKECFNRPRPSLVPHLDLVTSPSFPSGHSMLAAIVYLTTGVLAGRAFRTFRARAYILTLAGGVTILVGISRTVLGVHYPTDVFAGWLAGTAWALFCWLIARRLKREPASGPESETTNARPVRREPGPRAH